MADDKNHGNPDGNPSACRHRLLSVFTTSEKQHLVAQSFRDWELNQVDFAGADLRGTRFVNMSLKGCDFSKADLRGADFDQAIFGHNRFANSCLIDAIGISKRLRGYIAAEGGVFWYC